MARRHLDSAIVSACWESSVEFIYKLGDLVDRAVGDQTRGSHPLRMHSDVTWPAYTA